MITQEAETWTKHKNYWSRNTDLQSLESALRANVFPMCLKLQDAQIIWKFTLKIKQQLSLLDRLDISACSDQPLFLKMQQFFFP